METSDPVLIRRVAGVGGSSLLNPGALHCHLPVLGLGQICPSSPLFSFPPWFSTVEKVGDSAPQLWKPRRGHPFQYHPELLS